MRLKRAYISRSKRRKHMKKNFFGNDSLIIVFMGLGLLMGIVMKQETIVTAAIGAFAGYLGNEAQTRISNSKTK